METGKEMTTEERMLNMAHDECYKEVRYPVVEIFNSIQGEGSMVGMPVTFVRFAGCNLSCPWCDSKKTWKKDANMMSVADIVEKCDKNTVVFTGGEPCLQDLQPLITVLHEGHKFLCIETNGTQATPDGIDWVVCSPKPQTNYTIVHACFFNELKYIVDDEFDISAIPPEKRHTCGEVWIHPCEIGGINSEQTKKSLDRCKELVMTYDFLRLGIQVHKVIGVE